MENKKIFIHPTAEVSGKASLGEGTKVWNNAQVREGAAVGRNCIIGKNAYVDEKIRIGNGVKIQNNVCVYFKTVIEDDVMIGPNVVFTNDLYPRAFIWSEDKRGPQITIRKGASIGANSTVICGHTVGSYAIVGAGSVVTRDVPDNALVFGNPAHIHGFVCKCGLKIDLGKAKPQGGKYLFTCAKCGEKTTIDKKIASEVR